MQHGILFYSQYGLLKIKWLRDGLILFYWLKQKEIVSGKYFSNLHRIQLFKLDRDYDRNNKIKFLSRPPKKIAFFHCSHNSEQWGSP